ncbi:MAG: SMI1/KNR4 family protein [Ignavibacteria bacterium]|nr:SMI1/KNR4 family protein [Ignavibacteria bacterium]
MKFSNGIYLLYDQIFGIYNKTDSNDLFTNYKQETEESGNPIPRNYCPVLNNGRGDVECIILYEKKEVNLISPVIFWQHDLDNNLESPRIIANSFYEYIDDLIEMDKSL